MASTKCVLLLDASPILESFIELEELWMDGIGVPEHLKEKRDIILSQESCCEIVGGSVYPHHILLEILGTLRALRHG